MTWSYVCAVSLKPTESLSAWPRYTCKYTSECYTILRYFTIYRPLRSAPRPPVPARHLASAFVAPLCTTFRHSFLFEHGWRKLCTMALRRRRQDDARKGNHAGNRRYCRGRLSGIWLNKAYNFTVLAQETLQNMKGYSVESCVISTGWFCLSVCEKNKNKPGDW